MYVSTNLIPTTVSKLYPWIKLELWESYCVNILLHKLFFVVAVFGFNPETLVSNCSVNHYTTQFPPSILLLCNISRKWYFDEYIDIDIDIIRFRGHVITHLLYVYYPLSWSFKILIVVNIDWRSTMHQEVC